MWAIEGDDYQGQLVVPEVINNTVRLTGDWSNTRVIIGYGVHNECGASADLPNRREGDKSRSDIRRP